MLRVALFALLALALPLEAQYMATNADTTRDVQADHQHCQRYVQAQLDRQNHQLAQVAREWDDARLLLERGTHPGAQQLYDKCMYDLGWREVKTSPDKLKQARDSSRRTRTPR